MYVGWRNLQANTRKNCEIKMKPELTFRDGVQYWTSQPVSVWTQVVLFYGAGNLPSVSFAFTCDQIGHSGISL